MPRHSPIILRIAAGFLCRRLLFNVCHTFNQTENAIKELLFSFGQSRATCVRVDLERVLELPSRGLNVLGFTDGFSIFCKIPSRVIESLLSVLVDDGC